MSLDSLIQLSVVCVKQLWMNCLLINMGQWWTFQIVLQWYLYVQLLFLIWRQTKMKPCTTYPGYLTNDKVDILSHLYTTISILKIIYMYLNNNTSFILNSNWKRNKSTYVVHHVVQDVSKLIQLLAWLAAKLALLPW